VDERQVIHFSHTPPPGIRAEILRFSPVKIRSLPAGEPRGNESGAPTARLEVADRTATPIGAARRLLKGRVKNQGASAATNVKVEIVVTNDVLGRECARVVAEVTPRDLGPASEGTYEVNLASPCFANLHSIAIRPVWDDTSPRAAAEPNVNAAP
jgi:hypothetical protein